MKPAKAKVVEMNGDSNKQQNGKVTTITNGHANGFAHKPYTNGITNGNIANGKTKVN